MNSDQATGLIRTIVGIGTTWLLAKGYITSDTAADIGTAALAVVIAVWSYISNRTKVGGPK